MRASFRFRRPFSSLPNGMVPARSRRRRLSHDKIAAELEARTNGRNPGRADSETITNGGRGPSTTPWSKRASWGSRARETTLVSDADDLDIVEADVVSTALV